MFTWHVAITILGSLGNNDGNAYKKYHLKSEFVLPQTLSHLFYLV